jgi:hypothetical protein
MANGSKNLSKDIAGLSNRGVGPCRPLFYPGFAREKALWHENHLVQRSFASHVSVSQDPEFWSAKWLKLIISRVCRVLSGCEAFSPFQSNP